MARKKKETNIVEVENSYEIEKETQNEIRNLEQFYTEGKVDAMLVEIEKKKEELVEEMVQYAKDHEIECKWNREGDAIDHRVDLSPIVITNKFFKPITPIGCQEPVYNAEKLSMVFDYYCELLAEVNDKIGHFPSSLTLFCRFAGITTYTLRRLKASEDYSMRVIVEKIYDQVGDENLAMSQLGIVKERTTLFKMKSQNEMVEKAQPNVNISIKTEPIDFDRISERLSKYSQYSNKKRK